MGVLSALMQHDLKRLLAYHTVENIGIIFIGLGLALAFSAHGMQAPAALALTAALFHVFNHCVFKSLLFFGAGAVLVATGERDMEHLGGLIHRMPVTAFAFLTGCIAISALPPLNGFVSEWLTFQAILLSPALPSWGLKIIVPAVGAMLALSAALAAACFVKAFGVTFLGRPRTPAARAAPRRSTAPRSPPCWRSLLICLLAGILPGFVHRCPRARDAGPGRRPHARAGGAALAVDRPHCREPQLLQRPPGVRLHRAVDHRSPSRSSTASPRAPCAAGRPGIAAIPDADPATQYTADSFAQPIRRVFGEVVFKASERVDMPAPGDMRPARLTVIVRDLIWEAFYAPIGGAVTVAADRLNRLQFLTIRQYLSLVFAALVALLAGGVGMALIRDLALQGAQMLLVLVLAPLLLGFTRKVKARLLRRRGPPVLQPYRDLLRLIRKEAVIAENASWLFRSGPYMIFSATWVAAALVPTFATGLTFSWAADLIAITALIGSARFFLALVGMDIGTSFGGIGSSREMMFASLAEPAMIMIVFTRGAGGGLHPALQHRHTTCSTTPACACRWASRWWRSIIVARRRERPHPRRQSRDPPRAHHGARGDGARILRPPPRHDRAGRRREAPALRLAHRLHLLALGPGARPTRALRPTPSGSQPMSASCSSAASCWSCSRPRLPRCACSASRISSASP